MPKATITLDDVDGQISLSLFLEGGFQKDSNAHQHAGLILKYMDSLAGMKTEQAVQWVDGAYVPSAERQAADEAMKLGRPGVYADVGEPKLVVVGGHDGRLHLVKS